MVNTARGSQSELLVPVVVLIRAYVAVVVVTVGVLAVLSVADSGQATQDAWVHAVIVGVFAVLLTLRLRAARRGSRRAVAAVGIIAAVLGVANVVEALIPGLFPMWMRVEMVGIAVLMASVATLVVRARR